MATLADQLNKLADDHGLKHISIALYTLPNGERFWGASAHSADAAGSNTSSDTPEEALDVAIRDNAARRALKIEVAELVAA